jgi:hypothetical protein
LDHLASTTAQANSATQTDLQQLNMLKKIVLEVVTELHRWYLQPFA